MYYFKLQISVLKFPNWFQEIKKDLEKIRQVFPFWNFTLIKRFFQKKLTFLKKTFCIVVVSWNVEKCSPVYIIIIFNNILLDPWCVWGLYKLPMNYSLFVYLSICLEFFCRNAGRIFLNVCMKLECHLTKVVDTDFLKKSYSGVFGSKMKCFKLCEKSLCGIFLIFCMKL